MERKEFELNGYNLHSNVIDYLVELNSEEENQGKVPVKHFIIDLQPADL